MPFCTCTCGETTGQPANGPHLPKIATTTHPRQNTQLLLPSMQPVGLAACWLPCRLHASTGACQTRGNQRYHRDQADWIMQAATPRDSNRECVGPMPLRRDTPKDGAHFYVCISVLCDGIVERYPVNRCALPQNGLDAHVIYVSSLQQSVCRLEESRPRDATLCSCLSEAYSIAGRVQCGEDQPPHRLPH